MAKPKGLAAVVKTDVYLPEGADGLLFLIYDDNSFRIKFPSGNKMDAPPRMGQTLQDTIRIVKEVAVVYCQAADFTEPNCRTWFVPPSVVIVDWLRNSVGLEVSQPAACGAEA